MTGLDIFLLIYLICTLILSELYATNYFDNTLIGDLNFIKRIVMFLISPLILISFALAEFFLMIEEEYIQCPKCEFFSGDDWSQCNGACPMVQSSFYTKGMIIDLEEGKYTYICDERSQRVLRYGKEWRDETGNKFLHLMALEIENLRINNKILENKLEKIRNFF